MKKPCLRIICLLIACITLVSCSGNVSDGEYSPSPEGVKHENSTSRVKPADYTECDLDYELSVSDGYRTAVLSVSRASGVTTAQITNPATLSKVSVIYDAAGTRINAPESMELSVTAEAGAGLTAFFDAMAHKPLDSEYASDGKYAFPVGEYTATVMLTEAGYPSLIELEKNGLKRCATVKVLLGEEAAH